METLDVEPQSETTPGAHEKFGSLPEEDGETSSSDTGDTTRENEHASQCLTGWIDGG